MVLLRLLLLLKEPQLPNKIKQWLYGLLFDQTLDIDIKGLTYADRVDLAEMWEGNHKSLKRLFAIAKFNVQVENMKAVTEKELEHARGQYRMAQKIEKTLQKLFEEKQREEKEEEAKALKRSRKSRLSLLQRRLGR
jgi:hypothetical protein